MCKVRWAPWSGSPAWPRRPSSLVGAAAAVVERVAAQADHMMHRVHDRDRWCRPGWLASRSDRPVRAPPLRRDAVDRSGRDERSHGNRSTVTCCTRTGLRDRPRTIDRHAASVGSARPPKPDSGIRRSLWSVSSRPGTNDEIPATCEGRDASDVAAVECFTNFAQVVMLPRRRVHNVYSRRP